RFSEPMDPSAGAVAAQVGDVAIALAEPSWNDERDVLFIAPATTWPSESRIDLTIDGFTDAGGTAMEEAFALVFHTSDEGPPSVVEATPAEGSTVEASSLTELVFRFSEAMNPFVGTTSVEGATLGEHGWPAPDELRVAIAGLEPGATYRVLLEGFEDVAGNALDGTTTLLDGALDFTTTPDTDPPALSDSNPTHGQLDVAIALLTELVLVFDEPMDTTVRTASLDDGAEAVTLTGNWTAGGTELRFAASGRLRPDAV